MRAQNAPAGASLSTGWFSHMVHTQGGAYFRYLAARFPHRHDQIDPQVLEPGYRPVDCAVKRSAVYQSAILHGYDLRSGGFYSAVGRKI